MPESLEQQVTDLMNLFDTDKLDLDLSYYDAERRMEAIGVSVPPIMRRLIAQIGWPRTYVDSIEERLDIEGFRLSGQSLADERLWRWWQANQLDVESGMGHTSSLIHGSSYVTVGAPDTEDPTSDPTTPVIRVESPYDMVAETDPYTRKVTRALRLKRSDKGKPQEATLYLPNETLYLTYDNGWSAVDRVNHQLGVPPVVPMPNRATLRDRSGNSEILPELRSITDAGARVMMNMAATAELMAVPQRLMFGVDEEDLGGDPNNPNSVLETYLARIIAIENENASATQFNAAELRNFVEVLQELSKQAASYTGLPPQYLSFGSENPASAEAIRSAESRLVKKCERKNRIFGEAWEQVMRIAMLIMDGKVPEDAHRMETLWADPSTPTYAAKADAVSKLVSTRSADGRSIIPLERARIDLNYTVEERRQMKDWDEDTPTAALAAIVGQGPQQQLPAPQASDQGGGNADEG